MTPFYVDTQRLRELAPEVGGLTDEGQRQLHSLILRAAAEIDELRHAARLALPILEREAQSEPSYGYYCGGDPRDFTPDPEVCTADEMDSWKGACAAWERGEQPDPGGPHEPLINSDGQEVGHVTRAHYGMGTTVFCDAEAEAARRAISRAIP